ncbi:MAG TPA: hypothetical protein DD381_13505 [Lentisphaeria bacterium]|nr:MAG: hypothetical protein A2X47_09975 [Lentisphaerae bacterium GWF2_38_69]HBM17338.1 hypothetical protein [Lentisphaeria bacterium]
MDTEEIKFSQEIETGLPIIDTSHKMYIERLNNFLATCKEGIDIDQINLYLDYFQSYSIEHFESEEYLMRWKNYPAYKEHKKCHEYFCNKLETMTKEIRTSDGFSNDNIRELRQFIYEWYVDHFQKHDLKLAEYIRSLPKDQ